MQVLRFGVRGVAPLLMHNVRLADPTDKYARELKRLAAIRKKTDATLEEMAAVEWRGSLYVDDDDDAVARVVLPADLVFATLINGAKRSKLGKEMACAVFPSEPHFALKHDGPPKLSDLAKDRRFYDRRGVRVRQATIIRTRPRFDTWSATIALNVLTDMIGAEQVIEAITIAGQAVGFGDYRPRYGRFEVTPV